VVEPDAVHDQIRLTIPAEPEYGRLARITVSGLARRLGFKQRSVHDLRLAVDETIILLLRPEGRPGTITLRFDVDHTGLDIEATSTAGPELAWVDQGALARFEAIVGATVDSYAVDEQGHHVHLLRHYD
jgi:anti-sigma regulatory factor (Ser/Thr protein kinase)